MNLAVAAVLALEATVSGSDAMVWEHFPHGADIGVRGSGPTLGVAFEQIALALTAVITDPARITAGHGARHPVRGSGSRVAVSTDWLNALIYAMATRNMLFGRFEVMLRDHVLEAKAWGEPLDRARHRPAVEVKGATYTALSVAQRDDGLWVAQCIVDAGQSAARRTAGL